MVIRSVTPADRNEWLRLLSGLYPDEPLHEHERPVDAFLSGAVSDELLPSVVFVCEVSPGSLGGFAELSIRNYAEGCRGATPYLESWYVVPELRGRDVGRQLVAAAEQWALANGYEELASDALLENIGSHRAHLSVGFEEVERGVHFRKTLK